MVLPPQDAGHPRQPTPRAPPAAPRRPGDRERAGTPVALPIVTPAIVIANVAVMALMVVVSGVSPIAPTGESLMPWGANFGLYTFGGEWWRLVTSCFVHGGLIHLGFNMYVLWDLGRITERVYGSLGFGLVYLVAGIGGSFASATLNPMGVSVGASGAVFGVAGAFLAFLLRNRGRIDPHVSGDLRRSLAAFVVMNLAIGFAVPVIDQAAHVGGLVTGAVAGFVAAPVVTREGPARAYWSYPLVAGLGVAACVAAALGLTLR